MPEPRSRLVTIGLVAVVIAALTGAAALIVRLVRPLPAPPSPAGNAMVVVVPPAETPPPLLDKLPLPPPPLDRAALIAAARDAADAYAAGAAAPADNAALVGRSFVLRLPFGCQAGEEVASWTYNPKRKTVKFVARPEIWGKEPWVRTLAGDTAFDAAEGFWVPRPWTSAETCAEPAAAESGDAPPPPASRQTLGLAQFFAPGASRTRQRGTRPYEFTRKLGDDAVPEPHVYQLVLGGRLARFADGQPVRCWSENSQLRPVCLFAVELNRVAFEDPTTRETLAEWRD